MTKLEHRMERTVPTTSEPHSLHRQSTYIAPLDGLRALSVALVILFHLKIDAIKGGFVGVDVFFVISGFIITKGAIESLERGCFSYWSFLARRFFRLVPALVIVLLTSSALAVAVLTPSQLVDYGKSAIAAAFSVSNIFFYLNSGYFDGDSWTKPLLHTWSLGVEEQFYLLWPLIMIGAYRAGKRRGVIIAIALLTAISLISTHLLFSRDPSATFYLTPFRVYQLGFGALIALSGFMFTGFISAVAATVGVAGIIFAAVTVTGSGNYLSEALLPAMSASLFIASMNSSVAKIAFGNRVISAIGRRSYSLYLVHWPLIVLAMPSLQFSHTLNVGVMLLTCLIAGEVLHRFVEMPFRSGGAGVAIATPLTQLTIIAVCISFWSTSGFSARYSDEIVAMVQQSKSERGQVAAAIEYGKCAMSDETPMDGFDASMCLTPSGDKPTVVVLGDSFGSDSVLGLRDTFGDKYHIAVANLSGCMPLPMDTNIARRPACAEFNKTRLDFVKAHQYDAIILAGNWWAPDAAREVARLVDELRPNAARIYVMGVRVSFNASVADILVSVGNVADTNNKLRSHADVRRYENNDLFRDIITKTGAVYLDVLNSQCGAQSCDAVTSDGKLVYFDNSHLTRAGAALLARSVKSITGGTL